MTQRLAYPLAEAAEIAGVAVSTLRRATKATDPKRFPPPLRAKRGTRGALLITADELVRWIDSLPEA